MKFFIKTKLSENISETPEGFLLCRNVPLSHTGPLLYQTGEHPFDDVDGEMTITRTPDELFSEGTISSFEGKSVTIEHPQEFVSPDNWQELSNGILMNIRPSPEKIEVEGSMEDALLGDLLITVKEAIDLVQDGLREVSLGYDALWVQTSEDTAVHTKIRGNHCALVDSGRAGINCAIKDSKGEIIMSVELQKKFKKLFGKTIDEAVKEEEKKSKDADKDEDDKEDKKKAKDAEEEKKKKDKADDADEDEDDKKKKKDKADDADEEDDKKKKSEDADADMGARMDKIEACLAKILEKLSGDGEVMDDEDDMAMDAEEEEESEDAYDDEEDKKSKDADEEDDKKKGKAGDTMRRAEILAPGIKKSADVKARALAQAYKTKDGKKIIDVLAGGKALKDIKDITPIFVAASEMMKTSRVNDFASVRAVSIDNFPALKQPKGSVSADDINKKNAEFYGKK